MDATNHAFLRWMGGKSLVKDTIVSSFPTTITNFHDVFLGGGSILIHLLHMVARGHIRVRGSINAYDVNPALIGAFVNVRDHPTELLDACRALQARYDDADDMEAKRALYTCSRDAYNAMRDKTTVRASAHFVFLNKTGYRGMHRENKRGAFNAPFGHYKRVTLLEEAHLRRLSELFRPVVFECASYETSMRRIKSGDTVYLDPPYVPIKRMSFTGYNADGFNNADHDALFDTVDQLRDLGVFVALSNASTDRVNERFASPRFEVIQMLSARKIHAKNPDSRAPEVLVVST